MTSGESVSAAVARLNAMINPAPPNLVDKLPDGAVIKPVTTIGSGTTLAPTTAKPTTVTYSGYSVAVESESASGTGTINDDPSSSGGKIRGPYTSASEYLLYTFTNVPVAGDYTFTLRFFSVADSTGNVLVNNGPAQPIAFGDTGGVKNDKVFTLSLVPGTNTVRIQGNTGNFFQDKLTAFRSGSAAPTTAAPGGAKSYNNVVFWDNSIGYHPVAANMGWNNAWGMAATAMEKDYRHLLQAKLKLSNPSVKLYGMGSNAAIGGIIGIGTGVSEASGPDWEANYYQRDYNSYQAVYDVAPDLLIFKIGENVDDSLVYSKNFKTYTLQLLDRFIAKNPSCKIIIATPVWNKPNTRTILLQIASERGYPSWDGATLIGQSQYFAGNLAGATQGVKDHPGDLGMAAIADGIYGAIPFTTGGSIIPGDDEFTSYADQGWSGADMKTISNDVMTVGFRRSVGACICHASLKRDNRGVINDFKVTQNGAQVSDKGRQIQFASDYFSPPKAYLIGGKSTAVGYQGHVFDTGGNTVQGGSLWPALDESQVLASAIVRDPQKGNIFYAKIKPRIWGVKDEYGHLIIEQWVWLDGNTICYYVRHIVGERDNTQNYYVARQQENPCLWVIAPLTDHRAVLTRGGAPQQRFPADWQTAIFSKVVFTAENWMGAYGLGTGVTVYTPKNSAFLSAQHVATVGGEDDNACSYVCACPFVNYDNPGVYTDSGYIILGTQDEARAKIATLPAADQSFNFDFSTENHHWYNLESKMKRQMDGSLTVEIGAANQDGYIGGNIMAPLRSWDATNLSQIAFEVTVENTTQLLFKWIKSGESNTAEFSKVIQVPGTGRQKIVVNTQDINFNGVIATVGLQAVNNRAVTPTSAKITMHKAYKV